jgi:hypothetical protein
MPRSSAPDGRQKGTPNKINRAGPLADAVAEHNRSALSVHER